MNKETQSKSNRFLLLSSLLVIIPFIILIVGLIVSNNLENKYPGINYIMLIAGLIAFIFFITYLFYRCFSENQKTELKRNEDNFKLSIQDRLNNDAEGRRKLEQERKSIEDLFCLFELAKNQQKIQPIIRKPL